MEPEVFFNPKAIDYFINPATREVFFQKGLETHPFSELTIDDATALRRELDRHEHKVEALEKAGVTDPMWQLHEFAACVFGSMCEGPDFRNGKRINYSMSPCSMRGTCTCPYNEHICDKGKLVLKDITITRAEIRAIEDARNDLTEKESAEKHGVSINTVRNTRTRVREKINSRTNAGLAVFALKHGI